MAQYTRKLKKGIRWWFKFDLDNRTYNSKCVYMSKNEAKKAENAKYREISKQARNPSQEPVLSLLEGINSRLDNIKVKKSKRYYVENQSYYRILLEHFGTVALKDIKKSDINALLLKMSLESQAKGFDNYKINSMLRITKALFNHCIDEFDLDFKNPCIGIKPFSVKRKLKYIPPDEDIEVVLQNCDPEERLLIEFVRDTACRINEALRVTGNDIHKDYVILYTKKSRNSDLVPRKVPRPICLNDITIKNEEVLFKRWQTYPRFLEDKIKMLNLKTWSWHNLRHRKASIMSKNGVPLFDIMSLLGHSNLKTTQGYLQQLL